MNEVFTLKLNAIQVLGLAAFGVAAGIWLKDRIRLIDRLNIPASIVGGMVFAVLALVLRDRYLNLEMDLVLRDILMVAFFTTIGLSASLRLVRVGGVQVVWFWLIATVAAVLQNLLGLALAQVFGLDPLLGIIAGSVSLTGGPATALAFGQTFENMGVEGATTLGIAAATFGIAAGGMLGGATGAQIMRRYRIVPGAGKPNHLIDASKDIAYADHAVNPEAPALASEESITEHSPLMNTAIALAIAMGLGTLISLGFEWLGLVLPSYVGAMIAAAGVRNLDDRLRFARISQSQVDSIGTITLYVFIVMAVMTLRLWELVHLAIPMMVMLAAQVLLVWVLAVVVTFRAMGRDYDSAVMGAGFCGFMLGTTANALACMDVLVQKFGAAPRAFIVVPLVGAFLIDFTNALVITTMANLFR